MEKGLGASGDDAAKGGARDLIKFGDEAGEPRTFKRPTIQALR